MAVPAPTPEEPLSAPTPGAAPPTFVGPDLFNPPAHRGWITLTPSITIYGAYDDNLFLSGRGEETDDFFAGFIPGITVSAQRPEYQVSAGYNFSAEYYNEQSELNEFFQNHLAFLDGFYLVSPRLTLRINDRFIMGRDSNRVTAGGVSAGRRQSWRNTLTPGLRYQLTPLTRFNLAATYSLLRFDGDENAEDSDTYRLSAGFDHEFTRRLVGRADMEVAYFNSEDEPTAITYTPRLGLEYQFTPTLSGRIRGGPSLVTREDEPDRITPAVRVELIKIFRFGSLQGGYERVYSAESIGVRDRQLAFGSLRFTTLRRGFQFGITPRYTRTDRDIEGGDRTVDTFTVNVGATYQIARSIALIASYTFFAQREDDVEDIDQNRAFLGLQYAFPINFD